MLAVTSVLETLKTNTALQVAIAVSVLGLAIGFRDLLRLSPRRIRAVGSVCFRQSIRRRVLWITPLVIVALLVVAQFQRPVDPQDAVRQTTSWFLFAAGMLVTLVSIILACTNLPQEIENRVIYTVATKPVSRLEIVLGKVLGFAAVSFWILVIMGAFTFAYLRWMDWRARAGIERQLAAGAVDPVSRPTLQYYLSEGTLHARVLGEPRGLSVYASEPERDGDFWAAGGSEGIIHVPFIIDPASLPPVTAPQPSAAGPGAAGTSGWNGEVVIALDITARLSSTYAAPDGAERAQGESRPSVVVDLLNPFREIAVDVKDLQTPTGYAWDVPEGQREARGRIIAIANLEQLQKWLSTRLPGRPDLYVGVTGGSPRYEYQVTAAGLQLVNTPLAIAPAAPPFYTGRTGTFGQQVRGHRDGAGQAGVYRFRGVTLPGRDAYRFEMRVGTEPDRGELDLMNDAVTRIRVDVHNRITGQSAQASVAVENNRPAYFEVPGSAVSGGDFDVVMRLMTPGWLGLRDNPSASLLLVTGDQFFAWNLAKSLAILWLLSVLVIVIGVFCSTFLSWPIAVVLSLMLLSGHWGAQQLGDMTRPGVGRDIVRDMFGQQTDAATARAMSESVDLLVVGLAKASAVLPDLGKYAALADIERGVAIGPAVLLDALLVTLLFGIPLTVLAYVFLRYKEVAP